MSVAPPIFSKPFGYEIPDLITSPGFLAKCRSKSAPTCKDPFGFWCIRRLRRKYFCRCSRTLVNQILGIARRSRNLWNVIICFVGGGDCLLNFDNPLLEYFFKWKTINFVVTLVSFSVALSQKKRYQWHIAAVSIPPWRCSKRRRRGRRRAVRRQPVRPALY